MWLLPGLRLFSQQRLQFTVDDLENVFFPGKAFRCFLLECLAAYRVGEFLNQLYVDVCLYKVSLDVVD